MYMYICIHVHIYVCINIHVCMCVCVCVYMAHSTRRNGRKAVMLQSVAVCMILQYVAVCCNVLQSIALYSSVLQCVSTVQAPRRQATVARFECVAAGVLL